MQPSRPADELEQPLGPPPSSMATAIVAEPQRGPTLELQRRWAEGQTTGRSAIGRNAT